MTARVPSPLVGFNHNVRYRGLRFHIQTEDSGLARPHIITHLFADGGRVIKTRRLDYAEHVGHPDYRATVQRLMQEQHKAMALDLRHGHVDAIIDALLLPTVVEAPPPPALTPPSAARELVDPLVARPAVARSGVFGALPPSSLDAIILDYVARRSR